MKRKLTSNEIINILSFLKPNKNIPYNSSISIIHTIYKSFKTQLKKIEIEPVMIPKLKQEIEKQYDKSLIEPGSNVGILTAQSIGENLTQTTLNTFHQAGLSVSAVITGVPRLNQLLMASKKPKGTSCTIYLNKHFKENQLPELRNYINHSFTSLNLKKLLKKEIEIEIDKHDEIWYSSFEILTSNKIQKTKYSITLWFDFDILYLHRLTLKEVAERIENEYIMLQCVYSPINIGRIDIFVDNENIQLNEEKLMYIEQKNKDIVYIEEILIPTLEKLNIAGVPKIENIFFVQRKGIWTIDTVGSNFGTLLAHPKVDKVNTISNNIWEIYRSLGIEATRQYIIDEFTNIIDNYIYPSHLNLLADVMTHSGIPTGLSRYGLKRDQVGPMAKATFEQGLNIFLNAGAFGDQENIKGTSASIICGNMAHFGTGLPRLKLDLKKIKG